MVGEGGASGPGKRDRWAREEGLDRRAREGLVGEGGTCGEDAASRILG